MRSTHYSHEIKENLNFIDKFLKNTWMYSFIKIRLLRAVLLREDGQKERHDEANSCFSLFYKLA